ncbi:3-hydroxyacyl-CoA dehydrogenase NAD-binding domain-containing protein [Vreelandella populi]|uniref:3-hydroxyacyl-CoA dehydrogenase NAD-binding domain-containing protein n=1 Tax=Vreelandella populi TaxID=2498858 RepID=UPI000F8DFC91|nr:3-hydroxyacyl-CoA dehydrogenase NAD-binding domain-containing protein [Halomonas populi]RUR54291.1 3-hydroxyacyl-CoA dehydrogenase family protein [Halomonas populi]
MTQPIERVVIVGAGTMGVTLAKLMLAHRLPVRMIDNQATALEACRREIERAFSENLSAVGELDVQTHWSQEGENSIIIESVTENLAIKRAVIADAEAHCAATTLIVTNTSGLSIDAIGLDMHHPERLAGAHFFNPADLIPAVEVIPGVATTEAAIRQTCTFLAGLGKRPAVLKQSVPGFVANRIQHAIMRECLSLLEKGVVDVEALDEIVQFSIGVRLALNGPLLQRDLNGLDTHLNIARYLYEDLEDTHTPSRLLEEHVAKGRLGAKAGRGFYQWDDGRIKRQERQTRDSLARIIAVAMEEKRSGNDDGY